VFTHRVFNDSANGQLLIFASLLQTRTLVYSAPAVLADPNFTSLNSPLSPSMVVAELTTDDDNLDDDSRAAAVVESWLNTHPDFVRDYMCRCSPAPMDVFQFLVDTSNSTSSVQPRTTSTAPVSSGASTPVRKVSAQEFEKRGQTLSRMVTTVDGVPSFLAAGDVVLGGCSGTPDVTSTERRKRSELDDCELMNELIMDICNDLDVTSLTHKILQNVCLLLNADRCSLFHVERRPDTATSSSCDEDSAVESRYLGSKLFDVSANSTVYDCHSVEYNVNWGEGIVGHVAMTGQTVNIPDAYAVCHQLNCFNTCCNKSIYK